MPYIPHARVITITYANHSGQVLHQECSKSNHHFITGEVKGFSWPGSLFSCLIIYTNIHHFQLLEYLMIAQMTLIPYSNDVQLKISCNMKQLLSLRYSTSKLRTKRTVRQRIICLKTKDKSGNSYNIIANVNQLPVELGFNLFTYGVLCLH